MKRRVGAWLALALVLAVGMGCSGPVEPVQVEAGVEAGLSRRTDALVLGPPVLLADLEPRQWTRPSVAHDVYRDFIQAGSRAFFMVGGSYPDALWVTDGTEAGTRLVRDFNPLQQSSAVFGSALGVGERLYFTVSHAAASGNRLWRSDGTSEGTWRLDTPEVASVEALASVGSELFFSGYVSSRDCCSLWKSDGSRTGHVRLGSFQQSVRAMRAVGSTVFLFSGTELWKSDGTPAGTVRLKALSGVDSVTSLTAVGDTLYFLGQSKSGGDTLWKSDGTPEGTVRLLDLMAGRVFSAPRELAALGSVLLFTATDEAGGREPWKSDGTGAGTTRLRDIAPGAVGSEPSRLAVRGGTAYFLADDGVSGRELWSSDGTSAGTLRLTDRVVGSASSFGGEVLPTDHGVYLFSCTDRDTTGYMQCTLWRRGADGTLASLGTSLRYDSTVEPARFAVFGDTVVFGYSGWAGLGQSWVSDGTAVGTHSLRDDLLQGDGVSPQPWAALNSTLLFTRSLGDSWASLWRTGGSIETTRELATFNQLGAPLRWGSRLFFTAIANGSADKTLWSTDGTSDGLVSVFSPGSKDVRLGGLLGDRLIFSSWTSGFGHELWRTDGTAQGTASLNVRWPADASSAPASWTRVGGLLYFIADDGTGRALWRTDGTASGTQRVAAAGTLQPTSLHDVGGTLVFTTGSSGWPYSNTIWRLDATAAQVLTVSSWTASPFLDFGDWMVVANGTLVYSVNANAYASLDVPEIWRYAGGASAPVRVSTGGFRKGRAAPVVTGGSVLFVAESAERSDLSLWRTDATGTYRVKEFLFQEGLSLDPSSLVALEGTDKVMFSATEGVHGGEPWVSDGTEAGTFPVGDIAVGPASSQSRGFLRVGARVLFNANDGPHGPELWGMSLESSGAPPQMTCPANPVLELTDSRRAFWPHATVTDDGSLPPDLIYSPVRGSVLPLGTTPVTAWATDMGGQRVSCVFLVTVRDTTPPTLTCPSSRVVEATSSQGVPLALPGPTVWDASGALSVSYNYWTDSRLYPLGERTLNVTAQDGSGNTSSCSFTLVVRDTTRPTLSCPAGVTVEAASAAGARATYAAVTATDAVSAVTVTYSQASGSLFPLGTTSVVVMATDRASNTSTCSIPVTVRDTTAPSVTCPADRVSEATGPTGARVDFAARATDTVTSSPSLSYSQAPGSLFAVGDARVTVKAGDAAGNTGTCSFRVSVRDTTPPVVTCPARVLAEATGPTGALVSYATATAADAVSSATLTYSRASGARFALGTTPVTVWARDALGNQSQCVFEVEVRDTTPPVLTCPTERMAEALSARGAPVDFVASAADTVTETGLTLTYSHAPGGLFALGRTTVTASARDAAGNTGTCSFPVTVRDTTAPVVTCPAPLVREATSARGAPVSFTLGATDAVTEALEVTASQASGSTFPLGDTAVTASSTDAAGNTGTCVFTVTVRDTTPPVLTCPASQVLEATRAEGAQAFFTLKASDAVSARLLPAASHESGSLFPPGRTRVDVSVMDRAGNASACSFFITVRDTRASR